MKTRVDRERLYVGVDIGGTKIQASLVSESGAILGKQRQSTPRTGGPEQVLATIEIAMQEVLAEGQAGNDGPHGDRRCRAGRRRAQVGLCRGHAQHEPHGRIARDAPGRPLSRAGGDRQRRQPGHVRRGLAGLRPQGASAPGHLGRHGHWRRPGDQRQDVAQGPASRPARSGISSCRLAVRCCGCGNCGCLEALASRTAIERRYPRGPGCRRHEQTHASFPEAI